jgi:hypothetical protein
MPSRYPVSGLTDLHAESIVLVKGAKAQAANRVASDAGIESALMDVSSRSFISLTSEPRVPSTHSRAPLIIVIPAQAGIYKMLKTLDPRLRGDDEKWILRVAL